MKVQNHNFKDIQGLRFGKLTAIKYAGNRFWWCHCDCGKELLRCGKRLRNGQLKSCGCLISDFNKKTHWKHGHSRNGLESRTYRIWLGMKQRGTNPNCTGYYNKGIRVCDRWLKFENFLADMGECPSNHHSLDRYPNNFGHYEPGNVRWATSKEQARNTSQTKILTFNGKSQCLTDWCKELGIAKNTYYHRLKKGLSIDRLLAPPRRRNAA